MSDVFSQPIHSWLLERYPDAHFSYDRVITIVSEPINLRVFYRIEVVHLSCWLTYCGVKPVEFRVEYENPKMFDLLEERLDQFEEWEREAVKTLGKFWQSYTRE